MKLHLEKKKKRVPCECMENGDFIKTFFLSGTFISFNDNIVDAKLRAF